MNAKKGPNETVAEIAAKLQKIQRSRSIVIKSRNMQANRIQAIVAGTIGYNNQMSEGDRKNKFKEAQAIIDGTAETELRPIINVTKLSIVEFNKLKVGYEKDMNALAAQLPAIKWVERKEQRGFGPLFLAIVIGETGDLNNYANPAKVWRRLGCAPVEHDGKVLMGSTWRKGKEGKLDKIDWEQAGYSPRRRSIAYLIGEGIVKQNFVGGKGTGDAACETENSVAGPYRQRYLQVKKDALKNRKDWTTCGPCEGKGKVGRKSCVNCKGKGKVAKRCHLHAMLVATKLLLKELWCAWTNNGKDITPLARQIAKDNEAKRLAAGGRKREIFGKNGKVAATRTVNPLR